jgi:hypothetical protein
MRSPWNRERTGGENDGSVERSGAASPDGPAGLNTEEWDLLRAAPDYDAEEMSNVWPGEAWTPPAILAEAELEDEGRQAKGHSDSGIGQTGVAPTPAWPPSVGTAPRSGNPVTQMPAAPEPVGEDRDEAGSWRPPNRIEPPARFQSPPGVNPPFPAKDAGRVPGSSGGTLLDSNRTETVPGGGSSGPVAGGAAPDAKARPTPPWAKRQADAVAPQYPEARTLALLAEDLLGRPLDAPPAPPVETGTPAPEQAAGPARPAWSPAARPKKSGGEDLWDQVMPQWVESSSE